jgi:hypothetical protein
MSYRHVLTLTLAAALAAACSENATDDGVCSPEHVVDDVDDNPATSAGPPLTQTNTTPAPASAR